MKKKLFTAIITLATITLTSCQSVPASETEKIFTDGSEITSIETTETGTLYTFTDGTGYYLLQRKYVLMVHRYRRLRDK